MSVIRRSPKTIIRWGLYAVAFIAYVFTVALFLRFIFQEPTPQNAKVPVVVEAPDVVQQKPTIGLPARLKIPKANVDAAVTASGLTAEGAMAIPKDPDSVTWYELGTRPGQIGSAVIAGHYGWEQGRGSVFNDLRKLHVGDKLSVDSASGTGNNFIVRKIMKYAPDADATEVFKSKDGKAHLNLITCDGIWDEAKKSYTGRLIVFTDKV